jgi:hypothetical protein
MNSDTGKSAVAHCSLITANTATATATNAALSGFSCHTSLGKLANITTISGFSHLDMVQKARYDGKTHLLSETSRFYVEKGTFFC